MELTLRTMTGDRGSQFIIARIRVKIYRQRWKFTVIQDRIDPCRTEPWSSLPQLVICDDIPWRRTNDEKEIEVHFFLVLPAEGHQQSFISL